MADEKDTDEDPGILIEIEARYDDAKQNASKWREEARECYRFYADDQWDESDIARMKEQQRPVVTFNRTKRLVNAVIGHEANNRAEVRFIPRTEGDAKVNDILTQGSQYFRDQCDAEFEESDAFRDMLITGMGWANDRLSDAQNPNYDLIEERVDPMEMLWDPASRKPNLADSRYLFRRKRYTRAEIKNIWPDFEGPFTDAFDDQTDDLDAQPHETNHRQAYQKDDAGKDVKPDVLVLEYQYKEREGFYSISYVDPESQQPQTIEIPREKLDDDPKLKDKLQANQNVKTIFKRRTVTRRCFIIGRIIVQEDVVYKHDFTYHCITGYRDRERNYWQGIVCSLRDPQRWSNKWLAQWMYIFNSNAKGGLMMEETAVENMTQFLESWADPSKPTVFAEGALEKGKVVPKPPPVYPPDPAKLLEYANQSFSDVSGVNQELLGLADREQPGVLEWQRKQSAVTLLAPLFDSLRRFRKMQGRCWLYMMQKYISDGRMIRITVDQPAEQQGGAPMQSMKMNVPFQLPPEWKDPDTATFDVIVDQSSSAPNQKEQTWAVVQQLAPVAPEIFQQPQIMLWALEYSPLPETALEKLKQIAAQMQANPKPDPETMKLQAQLQFKQQEMQLKQQEAQANMQLEQQKAQMQLEIERAKMELELQKAQMQMGIEREKAQQTMALAQQQGQQKMALTEQQFQFDAAQQQRQSQLDAQQQQAQMNREGQQFERQIARDDKAATAKIAREDKAAKAKARRPKPEARP